jgi:hypothetical protein
MALQLTPDGYDLLLMTMAGEASIHFVSIQFGNGTNAGSRAKKLSNPLLTVKITKCEIGDLFVTLQTTFSNSDVSAGFRATETGVLVEDPKDSTKQLLYAYEYQQASQADYIPDSTSRVLETQMDVMVYVGNVDNVTASISQSLVYASKAEFDAFVTRKDNPHDVTKEQIGLGDVPNVTTENQTPTYSEANALAPLKSGETLTIAFGKLAKAVSSLISHLADMGNPHKVTAAQIGAAGSEHYHRTTDITSGVLDVARGGTGTTNYKHLRYCLGLGDTTGVLTANYGGTGVTTYNALRNKMGLGNSVGVLGVDYGGTGVSSLVGTDYAAFRVRGVQMATTAPTTISNGCVVLVYT